MTVTREQAQMLTALAVACRPHRAPTWDEAGVMAAIGKIHTWQLSEVALRVIVAASDPDAKTPAVIVSPVMRVPELKAPRWEPDLIPVNERCSICSKRREDCGRSPFAEHDFSPAHLVPPPRDVPAVVDHLRGLLVDGKAEPAPVAATPAPPNPHAEAARAAMTTTHPDPSDPDAKEMSA